ncbi:MAG: uracil-DNA glycosylase [Chloroflexota bacterium]|jgi:uracil-DNA glycosylase
MQVSEFVRCPFFPCLDVHHAGYQVPSIEIDPTQIRVVLISESASTETADGYYAVGDPLFARTTILAFRDAGFLVHSVREILDMGVYLTTAVKCTKISYGMKRDTVCKCSRLLEEELNLFPESKAYLLMGDVAIQSINLIALRHGEPRVVPNESTYKIRGGEYKYCGIRVFPSYLQAGPSYFVEASKRQMIAEDIRAALAYVTNLVAA